MSTTKTQVKTLWKTCFDDSEAFIDMYFRLRYKDEITLTAKSGESVISSLQMIPYPMTFCGNLIRTSYISGACTHPQYRRRGYMKGLLTTSFRVMLRKGEYLSTLIPANEKLIAYYSKLGYAPVFEYATEENVQSDINSVSKANGNNSLEEITQYQAEVYQYINHGMAKRPCYLQHTEEDYKVILEDLRITGGVHYVSRDNLTKQINGCIIGYTTYNKLIIQEMITNNDETSQWLLEKTCEIVNTQNYIRILSPRKGTNNKILGMARIINVKQLLELYAANHPEIEEYLIVSDDILPDNNGCFHLSKGICQTNDHPTDKTRQYSIYALAMKLLYPLRPYMNLMLN